MKMKAPLLEYYFSKLVPKSFGGLIDVANSSLSLNGTGGISYSFKITDRLCSNSAQSGVPMLSASSLIALFDEFSSASLMYWDTKNRPGVSILLSAEIFNNCESGQIVEFLSIPKKIGANIAFCDISMLSDSGAVLAQGQHIKYMPMGIVWDIFCNKYALPFSLRLLEIIRKNSDSDERIRLTSECDAISDIFKVTPTDQSSTYEIHLTPSMVNAMGATHGGALAMAAEKTAVLALSDAGLCSPQSFIKTMQVKYLSSVKVGSFVQIACRHVDSHFGLRTFGEIFNSQKRLCVQFEVSWGRIET